MQPIWSWKNENRTRVLIPGRPRAGFPLPLLCGGALMSVKAVRTIIVIDDFIGVNGIDSPWRIAITPRVWDADKAVLSLHWGDKEAPTHETQINIPTLIKLLQEMQTGKADSE